MSTSKAKPSAILIIGIGNPLRRDDGAGPAVAHELAPRLAGTATVMEHDGEGASLMESWEGAERVILIDAVQSGAAPGSVHRLAAHESPLPTGFFRYSSHLFGVAEAVEMARALGRLPRELVVYGIEGAQFEYGEGLSPAVANAVKQVTREILYRLGRGHDWHVWKTET